LDSAAATTLDWLLQGYGLNTGSYDSVSLSVSANSGGCQGFAFNNDGTKMYIAGINNDDITQYTLSTAFDISTATYDSVSFSLTGQSTNPVGVLFNTDGTTMFVALQTNDTIYQYTLSTAFDLSTASYASKSFSVGSQESQLEGFAFNNDGTIMYAVGRTNDTVYQYNLSTAFDISTASYASKSLSVSSQDAIPLGLRFNPEGTKLFVIGEANQNVYQYSLATAFDISTASYDSLTLYVGGQDSYPHDFIFNNDGTKLIILGDSTDTAYQYSIASDITLLQLGTGSFASADVGKTIEANSGRVCLNSHRRLLCRNHSTYIIRSSRIRLLGDVRRCL